MLFKFKPLLKQTIWGGDRIIPFKHLQDHLSGIGESWEISGVRNDETVVMGGPHDGKSLNALVEEMGASLVGEDNYKRFGNEFPLLIKFIDAKDDLSIQVHPNDETAVRQGRKRGKTEMWYVMDSDREARLYCGLKSEITPEEYGAMVEDGTICDALAQYDVKADDVFFIPAGRIHAIGAGCFLAEIQQTSDVTWRIYDYKRKDKDGNFRELHTKEASEAINYRVETDYRTEYRKAKNESVNLVSCPYFNTAVYDLDEPMTLDYSELDSFVILIGVKGEGTVTGDDGQETTLKAGETILVPASERELKISGTVKFLETFV